MTAEFTHERYERDLNALRYMARIRNRQKKAYAEAFWAWLLAGQRDREPQTIDFGLSYMGAQAIRINLYGFHNRAAEEAL